jgi:hypothetical protein
MEYTQDELEFLAFVAEESYKSWVQSIEAYFDEISQFDNLELSAS